MTHPLLHNNDARALVRSALEKTATLWEVTSELERVLEYHDTIALEHYIEQTVVDMLGVNAVPMRQAIDYFFSVLERGQVEYNDRYFYMLNYKGKVLPTTHRIPAHGNVNEFCRDLLQLDGAMNVDIYEWDDQYEFYTWDCEVTMEMIQEYDELARQEKASQE